MVWVIAFSPHVALTHNSTIIVPITEVWSPSRPDGQRGAHGARRWRRVDGVLRGLVHSSLPYWNAGAPAGNQHLNTLDAAEHRYALTARHTPRTLTPACRGRAGTETNEHTAV